MIKCIFCGGKAKGLYVGFKSMNWVNGDIFICNKGKCVKLIDEWRFIHFNTNFFRLKYKLIKLRILLNKIKNIRVKFYIK